jgi:hypothetical protein
MRGFVRAKRQGSKTYYYLVRSERVGARVRQKVILYLGTYSSVEKALRGLPQAIESHRDTAARYRKSAAQWGELTWWRNQGRHSAAKLSRALPGWSSEGGRRTTFATTPSKLKSMIVKWSGVKGYWRTSRLRSICSA